MSFAYLAVVSHIDVFVNNPYVTVKEGSQSVIMRMDGCGSA